MAAGKTRGAVLKKPKALKAAKKLGAGKLVKEEKQQKAGDESSGWGWTALEEEAQGSQGEVETSQRRDFDVFIGGLPSTMGTEDVRAYIEESVKDSGGKVKDILVKTFPKKLKRRSMTLVSFSKKRREEAISSVLSLSGKEVLGCRVQVERFKGEGKERNQKKKAQTAKVCFDFQNKGSCQRGDNCPFEHKELTEEEKEKLEAMREARKKEKREKLGEKEERERKEDEVATVFVGNLPFSATEEALKERFSSIGDVKSVRLVKNKETGKFTGLGLR